MYRFVGTVLVLVAGLLNLVVLGLSHESDDDLPWRAKWAAHTRQHPLLRGLSIAFLVAGVILEFVSF